VEHRCRKGIGLREHFVDIAVEDAAHLGNPRQENAGRDQLQHSTGAAGARRHQHQGDKT
jgi:hypothetical protein